MMPTELKFLPTAAVRPASDGQRSVAVTQQDLLPLLIRIFLNRSGPQWLARHRARGLLDYLIERADFAIVQSLSITASSVSKKSYSRHP
jgi:hypothetical protein